MPHVSGVPYGEGWSVSIPSITISTEDYSKYTLKDLNSFKTQNCVYPNHNDSDCGRPYFVNDQEIQDEGSLYWFAPQLSIPGVASGRLVFKCEDDNEAIFVLHAFEDYIEARFDGHHWRVILSNGADNRYYKSIQSEPEVDPSTLNTDIRLGTTKIRFYETHFFHDENFQETYKTSNFIKLQSQTTTHHDPDGSGHAYSITTTNNFFEADPEGKPIGEGYSEFLDTGNQLSYDPSWKLYSTNTMSDEAPNSESSSKHLYFYDLLNVYQTSSGTIDDNFDALRNVYTHGRRDLVYEERTRKASGGGAVENISYYKYDADWNRVRDMVPAVTVEVDTIGLTPPV